MFVLVLGGELIFGLPFHTTRFFRPTFLEVFNYSNTQLGDVFAVYGITAMLSYFPGGLIADRYSPRLLMTLSLFATATGGIYMATIPGVVQMAFLFGFWGISTILLFWAAMISATREWGGNLSQGKAFGILDGGRGLVAAAFAVFVVAIFSSYLPAEVELASAAQKREGLRVVILLYSAAAYLAGVLIWLVIPDTIVHGSAVRSNPMIGMTSVLRRPIVWAQAAIIICAYSAYKGSDHYSLYAVQVLGMNEVAAAKFTAYAAYLRPVGAVVAGLLADRFTSSRMVAVSFLLLALSFGILTVAIPSSMWMNLILLNILISYFAVFALRGIYFALLHETKTPKHLTGATVGLVSLVGYTPDIFFAPIGGRILDSAPGLAGHQHYFIFLTGIMVTGLLAVALLIWLNRRPAVN